jgi:hypothetical protein
MAYISDSEIMDWNNRIPKNSLLWISARYSNSSSQPSIAFAKKQTLYDVSSHPSATVDIDDPSIKYSFSFSIASNREEEFDSIFEKLAKEPFENHVVTSNGTERIVLDRTIVKSLEKSSHRVFEKEYLRKDYAFDGKLSSIMMYICLLETSIEYFSMIWGYDESGQEHCLLKYPIGNIVSPADDKSKDFLILDYKLSRYGSVFAIEYIASEMFAQKSSSIVKYGPMRVFSEKSLTWSRNSRIDDILN